MRFRCYPLRFHFAAHGRIEFRPGQASNLIRGGLGAALRRVSCPPECAGPGDCPRQFVQGETCAYGRLFEPRATESGPSGLVNQPRPFVLRVAHLEGTVVPPGSTFHVGLNLFDFRPSPIHAQTVGSQFVHPVPALKAALEQFGRSGLGSLRKPATLTLVEGAAQPLELPLLPSADTVRRITVKFLTPTELKGSSAGDGLPRFELLAARVRDRISTLRALYGEGPLALDFRGFAERAAAVQTAGGELHRVQLERRSRGTGQTHSLGGFVGQVEYAGDLSEFLPFLRVAVFTGVGRQTVWGKGEINVDVVDYHPCGAAMRKVQP